MKTFDLELRVKTTGSVLAWELFLENTDDSSKVLHWAYNSTEGYYYKKLDDYSINDNALDVYLGSAGKAGGYSTCTVIIGGTPQTVKVVSTNVSTDYSHQSYTV